MGTKQANFRLSIEAEKLLKDITRHTAASYWLAGEGETVRHVAKMLGHSEAVCESRYKAVKTQKEAAEFWKAVKELAVK
jgi:integrase